MRKSNSLFKQQLLLTCFLFLFSSFLASLSVIYGYRWGVYSAQAEHGDTCVSSFVPVESIWDVQHVPNPPPVYHEMNFTEISNASSFISPEEAIKDKSWQELLTPGGGFLRVHEPNGKVNEYGVSMFHQLHCLTMVREMLLGQPMSREHETSDWSEDSMHWLHCLDYLAQVRECQDLWLMFEFNLITTEYSLRSR